MPHSWAGELGACTTAPSDDHPAPWLHLLAQRLEEQSRANLRRSLRARNPNLIDLATNDYLGLRAHPRLVEAVRRAAEEWGVGAGASRLVSGTTELHERIEARFAEFKGAEAALILPTGYMANLALLSALPRPGDLILMDRLNHASLIDAALLSAGGARAGRPVEQGTSGKGVSPVFRRYRHKDIAHARDLARRHRRNFPRATIWLVSDSVFSMDGDIADLSELAQLRDELGDCCLILDEAHATGLLGPTGAGADEAAGHVADIGVSTASKALGTLGGIITGPRLVIDAIANFARPFIYTTAVPPTQLAAIEAALEVVRDEPERRERTRRLAHDLREGLIAKGWPREQLGQDPTPIIPLIVGAPEDATALAADLARAGFFAPAIRPPSVPPGTSRVRISVHADLNDADLERLINAFLGPF